MTTASLIESKEFQPYREEFRWFENYLPVSHYIIRYVQDKSLFDLLSITYQDRKEYYVELVRDILYRGLQPAQATFVRNYLKTIS